MQHSKADSLLGRAMRATDNLKDDFTIEVIETCETVEQAKRRERFWIRVLKSKVPNGYNRSNGGESSVSENPKPRVPKANAVAIAESLKRFRREFGLNKWQLAVMVGITPQAYQGYEAGTSQPSANVIKKIAATFKVSADYLLGLTDTPRPAPDSAQLLNTLLGCRDLIQETLDNRAKAS